MERECSWDLGEIRRKREWGTLELRKGAEKQILSDFLLTKGKTDFKWLLAY